ncbi:MAG: anthranilate phosphoribosyltransferase [Microcella sp.]|mgnify:CR=1 FL=1
MSVTLTWPAVLTQLIEGQNLSIAEATWAMEQVMAGETTDAQLAAFLVALRVKGETVDEIVGFRDAALSHAHPVAIDSMVLDIVGTGGDPFGAVVNVSSIASIVVAATGVPVAKHGNRGASSKSGASDVLGELGINLTLDPDEIADVLREVGVTYLNAQVFHPGFRYAGPARRELGVSTVFNILGPLVNPARPEASAVGVAHLDRVPLMVGVFRTRGATALVYRGDDGIDKLSVSGHSHMWEVSRGSVTEHDIDPRELGLRYHPVEAVLGGEPGHNADIARRVLAGEEGAVRDIVLLNAAAGLVSFRLAKDPAQITRPITERLTEQLAVAAESIDSGAARAKLEQWAEATQR